MKTYTFTKEQLTEAFRKWNNLYFEKPKDFNEISEETDPKSQAETLIDFLEQKSEAVNHVLRESMNEVFESKSDLDFFFQKNERLLKQKDFKTKQEAKKYIFQLSRNMPFLRDANEDFSFLKLARP